VNRISAEISSATTYANILEIYKHYALCAVKYAEDRFSRNSMMVDTRLRLSEAADAKDTMEYLFQRCVMLCIEGMLLPCRLPDVSRLD
jgi:hypothetical protein